MTTRTITVAVTKQSFDPATPGVSASNVLRIIVATVDGSVAPVTFDVTPPDNTATFDFQPGVAYHVSAFRISAGGAQFGSIVETNYTEPAEPVVPVDVDMPGSISIS